MGEIRVIWGLFKGMTFAVGRDKGVMKEVRGICVSDGSRIVS